VADGAESQGGAPMMLSVAAMVVALLSFGSVFMVYSSVPKPPEEVVFRKPSKAKAGAPTPADVDAPSSSKSDDAPEKPVSPPVPDGDSAPTPPPAAEAPVKPSAPAPENQ
jgi:hypothetical protein